MNLQTLTIGEHTGTVAYLDEKMRLTDAAHASWAKLVCEDGYQAFYTVTSQEPRVAARRAEGLIHRAADAHVAKLSVVFRYAFARGRQVLKPLLAGLRAAGDKPGHEFHGNQWTTALAIDYFVTNSRVINTPLRSGKALNEVQQARVAALDRAMLPSQQDTVLSRIVGMDALPKMVPGVTFSDKGFISASAETSRGHVEKLGREAAEPSSYYLTIEAPKGTPMLDVNQALGPNNKRYDTHEFAWQKEIILPRGSTFEVLTVGGEHGKDSQGRHYDVRVRIIGWPDRRPRGKKLRSAFDVEDLRAAAFDPNQPRDEQGQWTSGASSHGVSVDGYPDEDAGFEPIGQETTHSYKGEHSPDVSFSAQDLQDSGKHVTAETVRKDYANGDTQPAIYQSYVPFEDIPSPKLAERDDDPDAENQIDEDASYRGTFPAIKLEVTPEGKIAILDGNHRLDLWERHERPGYTHIPAWVIDRRPRKKLRSASHTSDLPSRAAAAVADALDEVLAPTLRKIVVAGGEAGLALINTRLTTAEYDEALHPRDDQGQWTENATSTPELAAQAETGIKAVEALLDQAISGADYSDVEAEEQTWDTLSPNVQDKVFMHWMEDANESVEIDASDLNADIERELRQDNDAILTATEAAVLEDLADKFPEPGSTLPLGDEAFELRHTLDPETLEYDDEDDGDGATLVNLDQLRFNDGGVLTPEQQASVKETWDRHYEQEFRTAFDEMLQSDAYYERYDKIKDDEISSQWQNMSESKKFDLAVEYDEVESRETDASQPGDVPSHWMTGLSESENNNSEDYTRTSAIANKLVELRTDQLLKERGLEGKAEHVSILEPGVMKASSVDTIGLIEDTWGSWKSSSSSNMGLALQYAAAKELGGVHRLTANEIERAEIEVARFGGLPAMQAYVRAQWETTQFLMAKSGATHAEVYRALMLAPEALAGVREETTDMFGRASVGVDRATTLTKLPDLALQRAGAQSTTSLAKVANDWGGVGSTAHIVNPVRVVLRVRAPRTSVLSLPVFGKNVTSEHETVLAGTKDRWQWDVWKQKAPTFEMQPMKARLKAAMRTLAKKRLVIDLQEIDRDQPHWLKGALDPVIRRWREKHPRPLKKRTLGGTGSGNFGHAGRPGEVGGSASGDTSYTKQDLDTKSVDIQPEELSRAASDTTHDRTERRTTDARGSHRARASADRTRADRGGDRGGEEDLRARSRRVRGLEFNPDQPRDEQGQWTDGGSSTETFFHGTVNEQVESIKTHGLKLDYAGLAWPTLSEQGKIYLAKNADEAMMWAEATTQKLEWKFNKPTAAVVTVRIPTEVVARGQHMKDGNVRLLEDVKPEWIGDVRVGRGHDEILRGAESVFYVGVVIEGAVLETAGGVGSGNFGHAGRPGEVGGSTAKNGTPERPSDSIDVATAEQGGTWHVAHFSEDQSRVFTDTRHAYFHPLAELESPEEMSDRTGGGLRDVHGVMIYGTLTLKHPAVVPWEKISDYAWTDEHFPRLKTEGYDGAVNDEGQEIVAFYPARQFTERERRLDPYVTHRALGGTGSGNFGHAGRPGEVGGSTTFFHGTVEDHLASIRAHGLDPSHAGAIWPDYSKPGYVYMTSDRAEAERWATRTAAHAAIPLEGSKRRIGAPAVPVVIEVAVSKALHLEPDANLFDEDKGFQFQGTIPPESIRHAWALKQEYYVEDMADWDYESGTEDERQAKWRRLEGIVIFYVPLALTVDTMRNLAGPLRFAFNHASPQVTQWAHDHAAELVTRVSDTTRDRIRLAIEELTEEGDWELATDRIMAAVGDERRATLIARHESMVASSEGQRQSWAQAIEAGLLTGDEKRTWLVVGDEKTCPICEGLDGKVADLDGVYVGEDGNEYEPPAHVQCRCTEGLA